MCIIRIQRWKGLVLIIAGFVTVLDSLPKILMQAIADAVGILAQWV